MKLGNPLLIWVWQLELGTALCHFWVDLAIRGSETLEGEQPGADNTLHKQLLTASPNWFRTLFLRRCEGGTNGTEEGRKETIPGIQSMRARERAVPKGFLSAAAAKWRAMIYPLPACAVSGCLLTSG